VPLSIAEFLGQRTDINEPDILPSELGGDLVPTCPFSGVACRKLSANPPMHPVCSVRVYGRDRKGEPFIVCSDRLLPAKARTLSPSQIAALASVAHVVFPSANTMNVGYKRQVSIGVGQTKLVLDYVLQVKPEANYDFGSSKVILEVQGGGETSSTGTITRYVTDWSALTEPTNEFLSQKLTTEYLRNHTGKKKVSIPGIIPNNAWKRQLDQILKKATLTRHFGGAFALVMGEVLYDYVQNSVTGGRDFFPGWEIALLGISETPSSHSGAIPINIVSKSIFMTFSEFITALQSFSIPEKTANPFTGDFATLRNQKFSVD